MTQVQKVRGKDIEGNVVTLTRTQPYQLSLFQTFLPDDPRYSNSIELFDATPKYFPAKHQAALRINDTFLPNLERTFEHRGQVYGMTLRPARLTGRDGVIREYYPSFRDELVEEALRKIACECDNGVFLNEQAGVQFTLYELQKELALRGHAINLPDILDSLKVCNLASMSIIIDDGGSTLNRGHEHQRAIRRCSAREGRPRRFGGAQRDSGTRNDSSSCIVQQWSVIPAAMAGVICRV